MSAPAPVRKHFGRNVSTPFTAAGIPNLRALDKLLAEVEQHGHNAMPASLKPAQNPRKFAYGQISFLWLTVLADGEFQEFHNGWRAILQKASGQPAAGRGSRIPAETRRRLVDGPGTSEMWNGLHMIKDRYQIRADETVKAFLDTAWFSLDDPNWSNCHILNGSDTSPNLLGTQFTEIMHRYKSPDLPRYFNEFLGAQRKYERAQDGGPVLNHVGREILAAGGLYKMIKVGMSHGRLAGSFGTDFSSIKSLVQSCLNLFDFLGGFIAVVMGLAARQQADFEKLRARFPLNNGVDGLIQKIKGEHHRYNPHEAHIQDGVAEATTHMMAELAKEIRKTKFWREILVKDLAEAKRELEQPSLLVELRTQLARAGVDETSGWLKPSDVMEIESAERRCRATFTQRWIHLAAEIEVSVGKLGKDLNKVEDYLPHVFPQPAAAH